MKRSSAKGARRAGKVATKASAVDAENQDRSPFVARGALKYVPLSRDEMIDAVRRYQRGDTSAQTAIICGNVPFVRKRVGAILKRSIFRGLLGSTIEYQDALQDGFIGLMKAADRFDCDRGYAFITYAGWWVDHEIVRSIYDTAFGIRLPTSIQEKLNRLLLGHSKEAAEKGGDGGTRQGRENAPDVIAAMTPATVT